MQSVNVINTLFPDGTLVNQFIESFLVDSTFSLSSVIKSPIQADIIEPTVKITSLTGIDFSKLATLLASNKWVEADEETALLICKLVGLKTGSISLRH